MVSDFGGPGRSRSCCKTFLKVLFSHLGLFLLVAFYATGGAVLYIQIEQGYENQRREAKRRVSMDIEDALNYIISLFWFKADEINDGDEYQRLVISNLKTFVGFVVTKASDSNIQYDGDPNSWDEDWTYSKSLLFTVTSMAAIGYGHIAPKTRTGRLFTILYNVLGIPLLLVFLANIGDFLANSCRYLYSRLCCRWCRVRRRFAETRAGKTLEKRILWKDDVGYEKYMATEKVNVPIMVNLCVITLYLMLSGALFSWWEGWDLLTAVYFTFITLTTIGFGDLVPGNSFLDLEDGIRAAIKMFVTVLLCLFGMALLSMCINLMQEQLVQKTRWLLMELGIIEEEIDPMEKYKYKKTKKGTVVETHRDRDGNKRLRLMNTNEGESTTTRPRTVTNISEELEDM